MFPARCSARRLHTLEGVLGQIQAAKTHQSASLDELYDRARSAFELDPPTGQWTSHRDRFLTRLPELLERLATAGKVDSALHDLVVEELEESKSTVESLRGHLSAAQQQVEELAALKDPQEAAAVLSDGDLESEFEQALAEARQAIHGLPGVVVEALFYSIAGLAFPPIGEDWETVDREVANGRLREVGDQEGQFEPDLSDPPVRRASDALMVLVDFVPDAALKTKCEHKHDVAFEPLWESCRLRPLRGWGHVKHIEEVPAGAS